MSFLTVKNLTIAKGNLTILTNCSFSLEKGQIASIMGRSGCGKTTLLRCISGLDPYHQIRSGTITLDQTLLYDATTSIPAYQRPIGIVFQNPTLFQHLSVYENIAFGIAHLSKPEQKSLIKTILDIIGLTGYENRYPHELSGGQAQRIAIARSLAPKPKLLLLDEAFSSLDKTFKIQLITRIKSLFKSFNMTVLLATHDQEESDLLATQEFCDLFPKSSHECDERTHKMMDFVTK